MPVKNAAESLVARLNSLLLLDKPDIACDFLGPGTEKRHLMDEVLVLETRTNQYWNTP